MSFSALLPRVRRYAAAFAGSVSDGDQWIEAALTSLVEHHGRLDRVGRGDGLVQPDDASDTGCSAQLKDFLKVLHQTPRMDRLPVDGANCVADRICRLPGETRAVVLLHGLEGLGMTDIADILGRREQDVETMQRRGLASLLDPGLSLENDRAA